VLDGGPAVLRDFAMVTNFGTQFAITGFVGYNFGCMIASDTQFDSRGGFWGSSYEDIAEIQCQKVVDMARNFGTKIAIDSTKYLAVYIVSGRKLLFDITSVKQLFLQPVTLFMLRLRVLMRRCIYPSKRAIVFMSKRML